MSVAKLQVTVKLFNHLTKETSNAEEAQESQNHDTTPCSKKKAPKL